MKFIYIYIFFISIFTSAQQKQVLEKSIYNIQIGTVGFWVNNETKLSNEFALRTEIGLYTEIIEGNGFFMAPEITLEPRWYYDIKKREKKGKNIKNNSSNFLTVKTSYRSNIFEISHDLKGAENSISIIPKWGIRRSLGNYLNYELGIGIGYLSTINKKYFNPFFDSDGLIVDLHLRIGLNF